MNASDARRSLEAEGYLELDLPKQAISSLMAASDDARDQFEWSYLAGESLRLMERYEQALVHFERARYERPSDIATYINLGWCYKRTEQLDRAIEALQAAEARCKQRRDDENHALIMYNLSCYYALAGRVDLCVLWLSLALEKEPKFRDMVDEESDFDGVRQSLEFKQALDSPKARPQGASKRSKP